ncbi:MAG: hypothetical protein KC417_14770, partial [Myxococcales bacterium]|nr:hypothetical protein [Myxococcales bacterium]
MRRRHGTAQVEATVLVLAIVLLGVPAFRALGVVEHAAIADEVQGSSPPPTTGLPTPERVLPQVPSAVSAQAGLGELAGSARRFAKKSVAEMRRAAEVAFDAGQAKTTVRLRSGEVVTVDALPRYATYAGEVPLPNSDDYAHQVTELTRVLDEAWDASYAHGHLSRPRGRQMFEFTGVDTKQRAAARAIYSPEGVVSVYMHGSPISMSRHAFVLEPESKGSARAVQVMAEKAKLATGETRIDDFGYSSIDIETVGRRLDRAESDGLPRGTPLLLRACSAGGCPKGDLSIAQRLADRVERPVIAASDIHYRSPKTIDGKPQILVHIDGDAGPGEWRLFLPTAWHEGLPTRGRLRPSTRLRGMHELYLLPDGAFQRITIDGPLANFAGRQNWGVLTTAAEKLAPGGRLTVEWSADEVVGLQIAAIRKDRTSFL